MRPETRIESHNFGAMGTSCSLFAIEPHESLLDIEAWIGRLAARLTRFDEGSEISQLNGAAGEWMEVSADVESILRDALCASEMSAGMVNVAVLPSMLAVGYTRTFSEGAGVATLDQARPLPRLDEVLEVARGRARVARGAGLDLGGVAKGWMADRAVGLLGGNAVANLGGDLMAIGPGSDGNGWPIGLGGVTLMLRDQGAATSSVRRRRWGDLHHLIDPRSGLPARTGLEEVSVVASSGFEAEVFAKTALLLGPDLAPAYCAAHALAWWLGGRDDC